MRKQDLLNFEVQAILLSALKSSMSKFSMLKRLCKKKKKTALESAEDAEEVEPFFSTVPDNAESDIRLPNHKRCASHTLDLVGTKDATKALKTSSTFS